MQGFQDTLRTKSTETDRRTVPLVPHVLTNCQVTQKDQALTLTESRGKGWLHLKPAQRRRRICHLPDTVPGWARAPGSGMRVTAPLTMGCLLPKSSQPQKGQEHFSTSPQTGNGDWPPSPARSWLWRMFSVSSLSCAWGNHVNNPSPLPDWPFCSHQKPIWSFPYSCGLRSLSVATQGLKGTSCSADALRLRGCNWELMCPVVFIHSRSSSTILPHWKNKRLHLPAAKIDQLLASCLEVVYHSEPLIANNNKIHIARLTSKLIYWRTLYGLRNALQPGTICKSSSHHDWTAGAIGTLDTEIERMPPPLPLLSCCPEIQMRAPLST